MSQLRPLTALLTHVLMCPLGHGPLLFCKHRYKLHLNSPCGYIMAALWLWLPREERINVSVILRTQVFFSFPACALPTLGSANSEKQLDNWCSWQNQQYTRKTIRGSRQGSAPLWGPKFSGNLRNPDSHPRDLLRTTPEDKARRSA